MWKTDLDGNVLWKKTYKPKAATDDTMYSDLASIALTDQQGGVVVAGEFRDTLNKFGFGKASIWLMQCDKAGNVLSETTFPGRIPSICAVGKEQFAIMYDASFVLQIDCRVRLVAPNLQERWEKKADFTGTLIVDAPAISPIPANRGFVLAGGNSISNKNIVRKECRFLQYNANGQLVSSTSIPITQGAFPLPRVVCGSDRAYVAMQTKGESPYDTHEASIFEILLHKEDQ
jgi:hypothetical protein